MATHWRTIPELLAERCRLSPQAPAFLTLDQDKCWQPIDWSEFAINVNRVSITLLGAGIRKGDRVAIMAPTSLNWEYAQMGALSIAATVAGIDQNYPADQLDYVLRYISPSVLFVQDCVALSKIPVELREQIKLIVLFEGNPQKKREISMENILAIDKSIKYQDNYAVPKSQDIAIIVFSSGSTGMPKAIHYSHLQILITIEVILNVFKDIKEDAVFLCWLPLANLFQRVVNFWAIGVGAKSHILSDPRDLMIQIGFVNPHILIGVPKVFNRIQSGVVNHIKESGWPVRYLMQQALRIGRKYALAQLSSRRVGIVATLTWGLADKLLISRLRALFGSRLRYFISGSAAMPIELLEWFEGIGLPVLEAYGVSENIIPIAINRPSLRKLGTVGKPLFPNQVKLAEDGEIMVRGPGVFNGYWNSPDQSIERFSDDGYWYTNDLGYFDEHGFLTLMGRKSDVFKTPEGKWVSPMRIEEQFQQISFVEQCIIFQSASGRVAAILSVDKEKYMQEIGSFAETSVFSQADNLNIRSRILWANFESIFQQIPKYQRPIGIIVTLERFTVEGGELTTNMKPRRGAIINNYLLHIKQLEADFMEILNGKGAMSDNALRPLLLFV